MWRIVLEKIATLEEIERWWSYDDLMRANAICDMRQDIMIDQQRKVERANNQRASH